MLKKINVLLVLLLVMISIGVVSASDDLNDIQSTSDDTIGDILEESYDSDSLSQDIDEGSTLASDPHTVTPQNYKDYFNSKGDLISSDVKEGDTIKLSGDFKNCNFTFIKPINVIGDEGNKFQHSVFTFEKDASGSSISNLNIFNTKKYNYGIFLDGVSNCVIQGCFINNTGASSYAICVANNANYNNITNNNLNTYGETYGHGTRSTSPLLISGAHYNYVANNYISCDDANAIYLSSFAGGPLDGGPSNFNTIYNNTIKYNVLPTSWSYGIQLMGSNNIVRNNKVIGAYLGISAGTNSIICDNQIINVTGADYNHLGVETGGQNAIAAASGSLIKNNTITNAKIISTGCAISVADNCIVEDNYIQVSNSGKAIHPSGSNVTIQNNDIVTNGGTGILFNTYAFNLKIIGNTISTGSGVTILIQKVSNKKMPGNISIISNTLNTTARYAFDAKEADKSMVWEDKGNTIVNKNLYLTPEGEFDSSRPVYKFDGKTHVITPENYNETIDENGLLTSNVNDGDILYFSGEFNKDIVVYVNKAVKITGNNPIFYNTTFRLTSDGVWIENVTIKNLNSSRINQWGVLAYRVFGATIVNCKIDVFDKNAAYAIYVVESSNVDVINNTLSSSGNYLTYTILAHTVEDCRFINNTIFTNGTGDVYTFENEHCLEGDSVCADGDTVCPEGDTVCPEGSTVCPEGDTVCPEGSTVCPEGSEVCPEGSSVCPDGGSAIGSHVLREVYRTYGMLITYASNNIISGNKVTVTSKLNKTYSPFNSSNSIVGIDLYYNCHNNTLSNNYVNVKANDNYLYGMGVLGYYTGHVAPEGQGASDNKFIENTIVLEGTYFVQGIVIGDSTETTLIKLNVANLKSNAVSYGINLEMSQNSTILDNSFTLNSDVVYGLEATTSSNNIINGNVFDANGKRISGILLLNSKNNNISENKIDAKSTGEELTLPNLDSVEAVNSGIYLYKNSSSNVIKSNNVTSNKGFAIVIDEIAVNNVIEDNYLVGENGIGDNAINATNDENTTTIQYNYKYLVAGQLQDINIKYLENGTFVFETTDSRLEGALVTFLDVDGVEIKTVTLSNGRAEYYCDLSDYPVGPYSISAKVFKKNFKVTEFQAMLDVDNGILDVSVANITGAIARNAKFTAILKNILGKGVEGVLVEFYVLDEGFDVYVGKAISDKNGNAILTAEIPKIYDEHTQIIVKIEDPYQYYSTTASGNLTAYMLTDTAITSNAKVYPDGVVAVLKDKSGKVLANKKISIKIGSTTYTTTTSANGEIKMPLIARGAYVSTISFAGDDGYYSSKVSSKITVLPSISGNKNFNVYYGNTVTYKVRITGSNGKFVGAGKSVSIKVNGQTYNVKTDKNGYATKSLKLKAGSYTITAKYNGDQVSNKITIKPTLTAKNIAKKKAKKIKFTAKLVDKNGKVLKGKKVTFKVKGKKYTAKTNKKGIATASFKKLNVGKYTVSSSYGGCTIYNTLTVKK